jgi:hypothetical protein
VLTFLIAATTKLRSRATLRAFESSIRALDLLAPPWVRPVAAVIIAWELAAATLLAIPVTVGAGFGAVGLLLVAFLGASLAALGRGARVACRCFGASTRPMGPTHIARDGVLLVAAVAGGLGAVALPTEAPQPAGMAVALAAAGVGVILVVAFDDLVGLFADRAEAA